MTESLIDVAPDFDAPIAVLKHCHGRIRKQLATLRQLLAHLPQHGADGAAQTAAHAIVKYFAKAAQLHHDDEEENLLPMLNDCASGADAALLRELVPVIFEEHKQMEALWRALHVQLRAIQYAESAELSTEAAQRFIDLYTAHMDREETKIAPMALRLFSPAQMQQLGDAMAERRGIALAPRTAPVAPEAEPLAPAADTPVAPAGGSALADLRRDYGQASLSEADVAPDPIVQFARWFDEALKAEVKEPNAMSLATVDADGRPSSRIVLIKQYDARGFTWYTNYHSQKGRQLRANPYAALLFFWNELERQIRIEGKVERTTAAESDQYFHSRPLKSRLAAVASQQSEPIADRAALEQNFDAVAAQYGDAPPRPEVWGGFRLVPERIEFWQGRRSRFHDRIVYTLQADGSWTRQRLQP